MNSRTRALIALVLTLALPLRVYAAVAMELCAPAAHAVTQGPTNPDASGAGESGRAARDAGVASLEGRGPAASHADLPAGHDDSRHAAPHSGSCVSCCCAALIAAAPLQLDFHPSLPPAVPPFARAAITSFVPDGLDRPPQSFLA